MRKKNIKKLTFLLCVVMFTSIFTSLSGVKEVNAHAAYRIDFGFDPVTGTYSGNVNKEGSWYWTKKSSHKDLKLGWNSIYNPRNIYATGLVVDLPANSDATELELAKAYAEIYGIEETVDDAWLEADKPEWTPEENGVAMGDSSYEDLGPLTFPAQNKAINGGEEVDKNQAILVSNTLVNSLNSAISFVKNNTDYDMSDHRNVMKIAECIGNFSNSALLSNGGTTSSKVGLGNYTLYLNYGYENVTNKEAYEEILKAKPSYLENDDYYEMNIASTDTGEIIATKFFPFKMYKGYREVDGKTPIKKGTKLEREFDEQYIILKQVVLEAHTNFIVFNQTTEGIIANESNGSQGWFDKIIIGFCEKALTSVRTVFGLYASSELVFGGGTRANDYFNNLLPISWYQRSMAVFAICMIIAWVIIFSSIAKLSLKRNLSALSSMESKVDVMEGYKNIIITGLLLLCIIPGFYIVTMLAHNATLLFKTLSPCAVDFGTVKGLQTGTIGSVLGTFGLLIFDIYMNFLYVYRSLIAAILFGISPICVASLATEGAQKGKTFLLWVKALLSVIMVPVIHAVVIAVVAPIFCSEYSRVAEVLCLLFAFIPITITISKILGLDSFDGHGVATLGTLSYAAAAGALMKKSNDKTPGQKASEDNNNNNNNTGGTTTGGSSGGSEGSSTGSASNISPASSESISNRQVNTRNDDPRMEVEEGGSSNNTIPSESEINSSGASGPEASDMESFNPEDSSIHNSSNQNDDDYGENTETSGVEERKITPQEAWKTVMNSSIKKAAFSAAGMALGVGVSMVGKGMGVGDIGGSEIIRRNKQNFNNNLEGAYGESKAIYNKLWTNWDNQTKFGGDYTKKDGTKANTYDEYNKKH